MSYLQKEDDIIWLDNWQSVRNCCQSDISEIKISINPVKITDNHWLHHIMIDPHHLSEEDHVKCHNFVANVYCHICRSQNHIVIKIIIGTARCSILTPARFTIPSIQIPSVHSQHHGDKSVSDVLLCCCDMLVTFGKCDHFAFFSRTIN